jgi:hypothetical protein
MKWGIAALVAVVALLGFTALLNARPARCPLCKRINVFRRARTGRHQDARDSEGELRRRSTEFLCGRCASRYWIVWDDFEGSWAAGSLPSDQDA